MDHKELVYAPKSYSNLPYTCAEGYETVQQQWMSLLATHHPLFLADRVPKIWYFARKLRATLTETTWCGQSGAC